jgi:hypothetical protein
MEFKHITDETVIQEYKNQLLESAAYQKIAEGYSILARLPENIKMGMSRELDFMATKYLNLKERCDKLIPVLVRIMKERGIEIPEAGNENLQHKN